MLAVDRDLKIRTWSQGAEDLFGWSSEEALGQSAFDLLGCTFDPSGHQQIERWEACVFHSTKRHKDGSLLRLRVAFEPLLGAEGDRGLMLLDREAAALGEAEVRHEAVVAALQEGVVVQAADSTIVSCNDAAERILGLSADQMRGRTSLDPRWRAVHDDGSPFPGDTHPSLVSLRTGVPQSHVVMGVHKPDGSLTWISINTALMRAAEGQPPFAVACTFVDITAQRDQEVRLREQEERLRFVLQGANDGFWDWHVPSGHATFSDRWLSMLGYSPGEVGSDYDAWVSLLHPEDVPGVSGALGKHLRGETPFYEAEFRMFAKGGEWVWVLARGQVVERDDEGLPIRVTGTHTDITARRETEDRLRQALSANEVLLKELRTAFENVKQLRGLLPVCAWCKSVRNDRGYWEQIEVYLTQHTGASFTHGLCPTCNAKVDVE
jgi:PAS domain S-box-containing protein